MEWFYHIFPCFLLELTLSSGEREGEGERVVQKKGYTYLPFLFGAFCFFLSFVDCIPVFSLSLSLSLLHLFLYLYSFLEKGRHFYLVDLSYSRLLT